MSDRSIAHVLPAYPIEMEGFRVYQPLPTQLVDQIDPFLLLHHFGPFDMEAGGRDLLDLGPHPHRVSRGHTGYLQGGDVQWMTAGRGIIHSERATNEFMDTGGTLEGIQLWVNLSPENKMVQPRYQDIKAANILVVTLDGGATVHLVAGNLGGAAVVSHGPYVMNNQTEILEAMRDYGMGKMGFYVD